MSVLPDMLQSELKVVFCGTAASAISAKKVAYYANPTNYFWRTLYEIGLTPHQISPENFAQLLTFHIGLTDAAKQVSGNDVDLAEDDFDAQSLQNKIAKFQPKVIAFTSKKAASVALNMKTSKLKYGLHPEKLEQSHVWILPSPSGAARGYWDVSIWQALADFIAEL